MLSGFWCNPSEVIDGVCTTIRTEKFVVVIANRVRGMREMTRKKKRVSAIALAFGTELLKRKRKKNRNKLLDMLFGWGEATSGDLDNRWCRRKKND